MSMDMLYDDLLVGQVLAEDDEFVTLKVCKRQDASFEIEEGAQFFTVAFLRQIEEAGQKVTVAWNPWDGSA